MQGGAGRGTGERRSREALRRRAGRRAVDAGAFRQHQPPRGKGDRGGSQKHRSPRPVGPAGVLMVLCRWRRALPVVWLRPERPIHPQTPAVISAKTPAIAIRSLFIMSCLLDASPPFPLSCSLFCNPRERVRRLSPWWLTYARVSWSPAPRSGPPSSSSGSTAPSWNGPDAETSSSAPAPRRQRRGQGPPRPEPPPPLVLLERRGRGNTGWCRLRRPPSGVIWVPPPPPPLRASCRSRSCT